MYDICIAVLAAANFELERAWVSLLRLFDDN